MHDNNADITPLSCLAFIPRATRIICLAGAIFLAGAAARGNVLTWGGTGADFSSGIALDSAGNVFVAGYFVGTSVDFDPGSGTDYHSANAARDAFVSKFDANGKFLWARTWGGSGDDTSNGLSVDAAGNVYVSGRFNGTVDFDPGSGVDNHTAANSPPNNDAFVCKYDANGNFQWARTWGGPYGDEAYGCTADGAGNVYVVGDFSSDSIDFDPGSGTDIHNRQGPSGGFDAFLTKFDTNGNFQWAKSWGGGMYTDGPAVGLDGNGNIYVSGMFRQTVDFDPGSGVDTHSASGGCTCVFPNCYNDAFLSKFDSNGNFQWARTWGGAGDDCGYLTVDAAGNSYVTGYFKDNADFNPWGQGDVHYARDSSTYGAFLSKFDTNGDFQWAKTFAGNSYYGGCNAVLDAGGNLYCIGTFNGTVDLDPGNGTDSRTSLSGSNDAFLNKFDANGNFIWAKTWGGTGADGAYGIAIDNAAGKIYITGVYSGTVNFSPWETADNHTAVGATDAYLMDISTREPATLTMAVTPVGGGTTSPSVGAHSEVTGDFITIAATPATGYRFQNWNLTAGTATFGDANASSTTVYLGSASGVTVTAVFALKTDQTITFPPLTDRAYGDAPFDLTGTASSGLPVRYASSDTLVATVAGNTVTIVGSGTTTITASQDGNIVYNPAPSAPRTLAVNKAPLTVTADDQTRLYGVANPAFTVSYAGFVNGDDAGDLDTAPVATCAADAASPPGTYPIIPANGVDGNYAFTCVNGTLTVAHTGPTITSSSPLSAGNVGAAYNQTLTANGGTTPYTWAIASGSLPAGLTLSTGGVISGTPGAAAATSFRVRVTGADTGYSEQAFALTIWPVPAYAWANFVGQPGVAGTANGTGLAARFNLATGVALDGAGNLFVADRSNHTIRRLTPAGAVTTFAGSPGLAGSADGTGSAARFTYPYGVAVDAAGNVFVADSYNQTIRKITAAGVVTTLAGSPGLPGTADGTGSAARFTLPYGVAVDSAGNVFVADRANHTIRKVTAAGVVTTLAGSAGVAGSADGTGSAARFNNPYGVAVDSAGNVLVADRLNHTIRKVTPAGVVTTLAGKAGWSGSADGTASAARFKEPCGVAVDSAGNIFVGDFMNSTVRKMVPQGGTWAVTTIGGLAGAVGTADGSGSAARFNYPFGLAVDAAGSVFVADYNCHRISRGTLLYSPPVITTPSPLPAGTVTATYSQTMTAGGGTAPYTWTLASGTLPSGLSLSGAGVISGTPAAAETAGFAVRVTGSDGLSSTKTLTLTIGLPPTITSSSPLSAGNVGGAYSQTLTASGGTPPYTWTLASGSLPAGLTLSSGGVISGTPGAAGTVSFTVRVTGADTGYSEQNSSLTIWPISVYAWANFAGQPGVPGSANGTGSVAQFNLATGVALDGAGNLFVTDRSNHTIRRVTPAGTVTIFAGSPGNSGKIDGTGSAARFTYPYGVAVDAAGNVFVADSYNHTIRKITAAGVVTTLAGSPGLPGSVDGTGGAARFNLPYGVAADSAGNVFVADRANHTIRKVTAAGVVATLAGSAGVTGSADGTGSAARFNNPYGVAVDSAGNVLVADRLNHTIRKVTPAGVVTTMAGKAGWSGSADGTGSAARFKEPCGVAVDSAGNIFVGDFMNSTVRKMVPQGGTWAVTTIGGLAGAVGTADGSGSAARFNYPFGLAVDAAGSVFVADYNCHRISRGTLLYSPPVITTPSPLPAGTVTVAYSQTMTAGGGTAPYTWTLASGTLPSGLSLSSAGVLSGTPDAVGTVVFAVRVTGSDGFSSTKTFCSTQEDGLRIGWAAADITPSGPVMVAGQFHARVSEGVADPITVTALALESGQRATPERAVLVSCDLVTIPVGLLTAVREQVRRRLPELPSENLLLNGTHTHTGPEVRVDSDALEYGGGNVPVWPGVDLPVMAPADYNAFAVEKIADAVVRAWNNRAPGGIGFGLGQAVVGRNRRIVYASGESRMYGQTNQPEFSHIEGYEDHAVNVLATWDAARNLTGLVVNVACPSQVTEANFELSADYWYETRNELRRRFGAGLFVLPQCSAAGDQSPHILVGQAAEARMRLLQGQTERQELAMRIADAVAAILPAVEKEIAWAPHLAHRVATVPLSRRHLTEQDVQEAQAEAAILQEQYETLLLDLEAHPEKRQKPRWYCEITAAYRKMKWNESVGERYRAEQTQPQVPVEVHVLRLGDVALATSPFELYVDYGIRIKARSPAVQTFVLQLAGSGTYLPTARAVAGKGYGAVAASTPIGPEGGQELVEHTLNLLQQLWSSE